MRRAGHAGIRGREVCAPALGPVLRVGACTGDLVRLVEERDPGERLELIARQRAAELPVRDVRAGPEALYVARAGMCVREHAFPVVGITLPKRRRQAPGLVLILIHHVDGG